MRAIVADILSLEQHLKTLSKNPKNYRVTHCPVCGKNGPWCHGCYYRKPDRSPNATLNPVPIPRFICPNCKKTCSALPECIPAQRWYPWSVQQTVLLALLAGKSLRFVSKIMPSRSTCKRWWESLKTTFLPHAIALRALISDLGRYVHFDTFWQTCMNLMPLSKAMRLCHEQGVQIP